VLSPSLEDYLEEVYRLASSGSSVRVSSIATSLKVSLPSVVKALHRLAAEDYIVYDGGDIVLTSRGMGAGRYLVERNRIICEFLQMIGSGKTAAREAEAVEHGFSLRTLRSIEALVAFMKSDPAVREGFVRFRDGGGAAELTNLDFPATDVLAQGTAQRGLQKGFIAE